MNDLGIDSHKLNYHIERIYKWHCGRQVYPLYMEIAPTNSCNHRCIFCAFDYLDYRPVFIDKIILKKFLNQAARKGVKSIMYGGEGEPLLHKDIAGFIIHAKDKGIDVAVTTNGVFLRKDLASSILEKLTWIRLSIDAASADTYSSIHRCPQGDFEKVISNLQEAVKIKKDKRYKVTIGVQFLLLNQNYEDAVKLAKILRRIGADYLIVKPYSQHPLSVRRIKPGLDYKRFSYLEKGLERYCRDDFRVIFRKKTMQKLEQKRAYQKCLGLSFWAYLASNGDLCACSCFLGDEKFRYGNVYKNSFSEIWKGAKRKRILGMMEGSWDISNCRINCRMDEVNRYLWSLKFPPPHVNFI